LKKIFFDTDVILDISIKRELDIKDSVKLINLLESNFNDFEDAIQYFTAIENSMDCIITRNVDDYKKSIIPVYTPTELLKQIET